MSKDIFEKDGEKLILDIPKEERYLNTASYDYSVEFIVGMMQNEHPKIILEVPFQRQYVWNDDKASQLIESIIMNVPIPPIYFAEEEDGKWLVIDGLQRLNSLLRFFQNEFGLKNLDILKDLEKNKFKDLPPKAKSLLANGLLRVNVIKKDSHEDIKYDIFMRLNKGAVTLNYQELRNCLYRGNLNNIAKNIVNTNTDLLAMLNLKHPHNRFVDVEFVIRFFSLFANLQRSDSGNYLIDGYTGRMVTFINSYMKGTKNISLEEARNLEAEFNKTIDKVKAVFGLENSFKDLTAAKLKPNKALADAILLSFTKFDKDKLVDNKDTIKQLLIDLLDHGVLDGKADVTFADSISLKTSDKDILNGRINTWLKALENALQI
ncbi:DUF262 domain-containing protein [Pontibacter virosus]|uniref:Uncharacterized protein DUF262 n=1 Tax=Pontibacter virosus TaxID=1765052 RepID=A0A2U1AWW2_9BACT|nr:DUF262 domain-containing protein [Pontibacter virosus]PVY40882.1 uncharacterized protein DUF262 [Pontibacter virosus]